MYTLEVFDTGKRYTLAIVDIEHKVEFTVCMFDPLKKESHLLHRSFPDRVIHICVQYTEKEDVYVSHCIV